jgi:type VI secretion system FHA domain protein
MIEIQVVSRAGRPWRDPQPVRFDRAGGDIGRGADCALVLEDPERRISRRQAAIVYRDGGYLLRQVGAGPGIEVAGRPLAVGEERALAQGDEIRIGPYVLRVLTLVAATSATGASAAPRANGAQAATDPMALFESLGVATPRSPLRTLLGREPAQHPIAATSAAPTTDRTARELDVNVGDPTGAQPLPAAGAAVSAGPRADDALAAFLAGAGVPDLERREDALALMRAAGALFREAMQGTLDLLAARSSAKRELHADATVLRSRENNPLKFSPSVETAIAHLLAPSGRGFMPPAPALRDAFDDLRAHQLAVLAGMRAALGGVLGRFDPAKLEERLTRKSTWDALVPAGRKAKLWDLYTEHYAELGREAEDDFDALFGRAFLEAYAAQLGALRTRDE